MAKIDWGPEEASFEKQQETKVAGLSAILEEVEKEAVALGASIKELEAKIQLLVAPVDKKPVDEASPVPAKVGSSEMSRRAWSIRAKLYFARGHLEDLTRRIES